MAAAAATDERRVVMTTGIIEEVAILASGARHRPAARYIPQLHFNPTSTAAVLPAVSLAEVVAEAGIEIIETTTAMAAATITDTQSDPEVVLAAAVTIAAPRASACRLEAEEQAGVRAGPAEAMAS